MEKSDHDLLIELHTMVEEMRGRLFGNGQPGKCRMHDDRISRLELWRSGIVGVLIFLSAASGVVMFALSHAAK